MKYFVIFYKISGIIPVLIFMMVVSSCLNEENAIKREWTGKEIILPEVNSNNEKIVVRFLGDCASCLETVGPWKEFSSTVKQFNENIDLVFYVDVINEEMFEDVRVQLDFADYVIFDQRNAFFRLNLLQFPYDLDYQVFLLNEKNEIVLFGSPIYHAELEKEYLENI